MTVDHLYFGWFIRDGRPWAIHECVGGEIDTWQLPTPWHVNEAGDVSPSLDCKKCGRHTILFACDRVIEP